MNVKNQFLLTMGVEARKHRVPYWNDLDTVSIRITETSDWKDVGLWFRTAGCSYDAQGGCLMCDYSNGPITNVTQMVSYVAEGLKTIPADCRVLLVSPSGSMLDSKEVPHEALIGILHLLSETCYPHIVFETRAETITEDVITLCKSYLGERFHGLYVGLESISPFILKHCINKQLEISAVLNAIYTCNKYDVKVMVNALVGAPFLSVEECITTAVQTVTWALSNGAFRCDLFPLHVKKFTPLLTLYEAGLYNPPSFWTLAELLNSLDEIKLSQTGLSWYTSNGAYNIVASPTTCKECEKKMLSCLSDFAHTHDPHFVHQMDLLNCTCKEDWYRKRNSITKSLPERVIYGYKTMANRLIGADWWKLHADRIKEFVFNDWIEGGERIAI
jgi:radical SAM enzyme (TIGR01210 family)